MQSDNSMTTQKKEEIRLRKLEQERIQANLFKAVVDLKQEVNNPGEQNPETHLFVTPPNILKQQLTGYCTSLASSPMGRDNKQGWYEEHEKFVAIATRSLSSVLLVGDSLVNGLARYHRVWSKYLEPLRALNFGVGGDRTQHVLWRIENGEIPLNLQVAFIHCGTNNLDRDNPAEIRDGIASIVYTIQEKKPNANFIVSGLLPRDQVNNYYKKLNLKGKNFSFAPVAPATILKLLKQLNPAKSAGIDNLTGKFLKEGAPVLASPITDLVNLSISLSLFPDDCKIAKLKPLYKKEAKTKPKNYRPISLLPLLSKIIERIIHNQTQEFLDKNNILYKYQSGFRKHHSTDTCLSYLTDKVKIGFEEGLLTGMVLIDLQKAFDTIDHSILLEKMSCLGFAGKTIAWFTSYLTNRSFIVNVGKESSSPGKLSCGVPQGSILGPLLFFCT